MKINPVFSIAIVFFLVSCGNVEKENNKETNMITEEIKSDSSQKAETTSTPSVAPYLNQLEYGKIKFQITSPQSANANSFSVIPSGFTASNDTIKMECEGIIVQSEVADLDGDNAPELLVVSQSGADKKGKAFLFSANKNKSMSMVSIPDISSDSKLTAGYAGQDEFALIESSFSHRFPLYENGKPVNKTRQLQYKLKPGEAMKKLVLTKTLEY